MTRVPAEPPMKPMLARLVRELPEGDAIVFEPKWDGFRCVTQRVNGDIEMFSRTGRPLGRYFPELTSALHQLPVERFVIDGEIIARNADRVDFASLMARIHPSPSRVARLSRETPASFMAFDVVRVDDRDLMNSPFCDRRAELEQLLAAAGPPLFVTPATRDRRLALEWLHSPPPGGVDGVMAKQAMSPYVPGKRVMSKVKLEHTADCVVAGFRLSAAQHDVSSLLLGLYVDDTLRHVGVAGSFDRARRQSLLADLGPHVVALSGHPWRHGFALEGGPMGRLPGAAGRWTPDMTLDWVPVAPCLVVEVGYDQLDGIRFRHPARFHRWRPDRDPHSCTTAQLIGSQ
ncbi:MAG TPA: ATP-dependent DNA ligase [Ilumatobacteraceae bacterium]